MVETLSNFAASTLGADISVVSTALVVADGSKFPASGNFRIRIDDELMLVGARAGANLSSITRGIEGTTVTAHSAGAAVRHVLSAAGLQRHIDDRIAQLVVNVKDAAYGATGDGVTDDAAALAAAITAAGPGGTVFFPAGDYRTTVGLVPLSGQTWIGTGRQSYGTNTFGSRITYTGTGTAIDLTGTTMVSIGRLKIRCTNAAVTAGLKLGDPSNQNSFRDLTIEGSGTSAGTAILFSGQTSCSCHNLFERIDVASWQTGVRLSGFANANEFRSMWFGIVATPINFTATGADTVGGNDNEFSRIEIDGNTTTGIVLASSASRNVFIKVVEDGTTTTSLTIASGCLRNIFIGCFFSPLSTIVDSANSNRTIMIGCSGGSVNQSDGIQIGDVGWYRDNTSVKNLKTEGDVNITGAGGSGLALRVGGYAGSLAGVLGAGVGGNSEFSGAIAIGGALNHDGTTVGFYGTIPQGKPTVTGSRGGNAALASLLTALASLGLITDSSSA